MIKAVLLDLDNTLLHNPDEVFAGAYLQLVDDYFRKEWQYDNLSGVLLQTIRAMAGKRDMQQTNMGIAESIIAQATGRSKLEIQNTFATFYKDVYPQLKQCVESVGAIAQQLVEAILESQLALVIATNPLYPAEAVQQRLAWAGLPDRIDYYALVTHAGNMHFTKPSPAYYAEIVARVGIEPDEAIMIGDSQKNDIAPAKFAGLHTYPIVDIHDPSAASMNESTITSFYQEMTQDEWAESLPPRPPTPEMIEPEMRGNIGALFGTLADAKPHYWQQHPDPNEWSPIQIICHLLDSERKVQRPRLERILAEDNPFLIAPPPPAGPKDALPCDDDGLRVAQQMAIARQETLDWLLQIRDVDWNRPARHSIFGPTTLLEMAHFTTQHDRLHINQLCQTLGRCD